MTRPSESRPPSVDAAEARRELASMTRRGFAIGGAAVLTGLALRHYLANGREFEGLSRPLRKILEADERVARAAFAPARLAPSFPASAARKPRVNGSIGLGSAPSADRFQLRVEGPAGAGMVALARIRALPRVEMTTELKCIEGWSTVVRWAGARLSDLADLTGLAYRDGRPGGSLANLLPYVALTTPDRRYYVGLDIPSALHPQTLLCYEMDGRPLEPAHGAPLRLATPLKYGIKSIKNLATIRFTEQRPADYWGDRGYDWYAGH